MKYENFLHSEDDHELDRYSPSLQRELMQLNKVYHNNLVTTKENSVPLESVFISSLYVQVNEELGCIFPTFKEFPCKGNALERVLALEIELAEALQEKKKSSLHFQRCTTMRSTSNLSFLLIHKF